MMYCNIDHVYIAHLMISLKIIHWLMPGLLPELFAHEY